MSELHTALEDLKINADGASPSMSAATSNPHVPNSSFALANLNYNGGDIPEKYKQQLAALLQRTAQGGWQNSAQLASEVTSHLPALLALAKVGKLDATQLVQLKTLVRVGIENRNRAAQQPSQLQDQGQRAGQGSPQVLAQTQQQNMQQSLGINVNGAGPSINTTALSLHVPNPGFAPANNNGGDPPERHKQQLAALLQRTAQGGLQNSAQLTSAVPPHLPALLALAKAGRLDATQLARLKTLVRMLTEPGQQQAQGQRAGQGSPHVPVVTPSFLNDSTTVRAPPRREDSE